MFSKSCHHHHTYHIASPSRCNRPSHGRSINKIIKKADSPLSAERVYPTRPYFASKKLRYGIHVQDENNISIAIAIAIASASTATENVTVIFNDTGMFFFLLMRARNALNDNDSNNSSNKAAIICALVTDRHSSSSKKEKEYRFVFFFSTRRSSNTWFLGNDGIRIGHAATRTGTGTVIVVITI
jgi:hypothetical protein